tara:strand:- start:149 stop:1000 length:852 start_codon:yes stop_codon:yes gene_type:complete
MVNKKKILVTGSNGQLGRSFREISDDYPFDFFFKSKSDLNIIDKKSIYNFVREKNINCLINCAAYTNVEEAEKNPEKAYLVNSIAVGHLAEICSHLRVQLIHISTDFIFDGVKKTAYTELDQMNPINNYGKSKLEGEYKILNSSLKNSLIIRTSWLYSKFGNNFVNNIINNMATNDFISVVDDQFGSPTNSLDLASVILQIIPRIANQNPEIYNFANLGYCSRHDFAVSIKKLLKNNVEIKKIKSTSLVQRPKFSPLSSEKIKNNFNLEIFDWKSSLINLLKK